MKIDNGKFVRMSDDDLGVVVNDKIIYRSGGWDELNDFEENGKNTYNCIIAIYDARSFNTCRESKIIWSVPKKILDDKEKEYLSAVIKPFRKKVCSIKKIGVRDKEFICINLGGSYMTFPSFESNTMYKGMKIGVSYTLEELGL